MFSSCNAKNPKTDTLEPETTSIITHNMDPRLADISAALSALSQISPERAIAAITAEAAIMAEPEPFLKLLEKVIEEERIIPGLFLPVDKKNELPKSYEPSDLVSLNDYPIKLSRKDLRLRKAIMPYVIKMSDAAAKDGADLIFASSYRSWDYQKGLFERYSQSYGEAEASRFSARPGQSQHQLGTVIDFAPIDDSFASQKAGRWMQSNAAQYGFSLSFPEGMEAVTGYIWESWHYRYISVPACIIEKEYFGGVQQFFLEFLNIYFRNSSK